MKAVTRGMSDIFERVLGGFLCTGQTQDPAGSKPAAACHILVNYPNEFPPLKSMNRGCSCIFMKILLCLLIDINWILSMWVPASEVWGSLQVREGWWRGSGDWQEVPSFPASLSLAPARTAFD